MHQSIHTQLSVLTHLSAVDLANEFINSAKTMMVDVNVCRESDAVQTLLALCENMAVVC